MAAYGFGSLQHIFEKPLPEKPTLLESLSSWNQIKSSKPIEDSSSFTEIFGELHFKENPELLPSSTPHSSSSSSSSSPQAGSEKLDNNEGSTKCPSSDVFSSSRRKQYHKNSDSFSTMNSESLQLCTEGLGFESSGDVADLKTDLNNCWQNQEERTSITKHMPHENQSGSEFRRSRTGGGAFPPPISCIGETGKPWVCFKSYRQDGRFVLKEIRSPTKEFLHARREDGRLTLQFLHLDNEILEEEEENDDNDDDDESIEINGKDEEEEEKEENTGHYTHINTNKVAGDTR